MDDWPGYRVLNGRRWVATKRAKLFLVVFLGATIGLGAVTLWYVSVFQGHVGSVTGMMGQMVGNTYAGGMQPMPSGVWVGLLVLSGGALVGVAGFVYYVTIPEITVKRDVLPPEKRPEADPGQSWSALVRTSNLEERRVLEVLKAHSGKYLQKFVVKESGLSRLKTHRILSRFAERGVICAEKKGNTNEISLAPWLLNDISTLPSTT